MWLLWLLFWLQPYSDCRLRSVEEHLIKHYLSWSAAKENLSFADHADQGFRCSAVRLRGTLYVDLPLRRRKLGPAVSANLDLDQTVLTISPWTIPAVARESWNPSVIQSSFVSYLQERGIRQDRMCSILVPGQIKPWSPDPLDATKKRVLGAMAGAARKEIPRKSEWVLSVADFSVDDPYVNVVLANVKTGEHVFGTFALNRLDSALVAFDRLHATDIERITPQELIGSKPITITLRR